jgi:hypothetical protein
MVLIVDDLLKIPFTLGMKVMEEISAQVDEELLNTEEAVRNKRLEIQWQYETNQINKPEFERLTELLKHKLNEIRDG